MKRSKFFLGITTLLLTGSAVVLARHFSGSRTAFYITKNESWCLMQSGVQCTMTGVLDCLIVTRGFSSTHVFTNGPQGAYNQANPINCTHKVKYNGIAN